MVERVTPRAIAGLEITLPLLITGLLALVIGGFSWGAYTQVRDVTLGAAAQHLERVTTQLAASLRAGAPQRSAELHHVTDDPAIRAYVAHGGRAGPAPRRVLEAFTARDSLNTTVEAWSVAGEQLVAVGRPLAPLGGGATQALIAAAPDSGVAFGPLRAVGDTVLFPVIAAVTVGGRRAGYLVDWRRVEGSPDATRRLTELIGADAAILVGNVSGDVWTDLSTRVSGPPTDVSDRPGVIEYTRPGRGPALARARGIGGTPWILVAE